MKIKSGTLALGCAATVFSAAAAAAPKPTPLAESIARLRAESHIATYGTYSLVRDSAGQTYKVAMDGRVTPVTDGHQLLMNRGTIDTRSGEAAVPAQLKATAATGPALHLVQFSGPVRQQWLNELKAAGVTPVQYIPTNGYLVWADKAGRARLDTMAAAKSTLQYAGDYHPFYKLDDQLAEAYSPKDGKGPSSEPILVNVQVYNHGGLRATYDSINAIASEQAQDWYDVLSYRNGRFLVNEADIPRIAALPDVVVVERYIEPVLHDEVQAQIVRGAFNGDQSGPVGIGYLPWLLGKGFSTDPADYPVVDVTDDGVDATSGTEPNDPTLRELGLPGGVSRYLANFNCTNAGNQPEGHGHINANIIGGYDIRSNTDTVGSRFPITDVALGLGYQRGQGINPFARISSTRIFGGNYNITNCGSEAGVIRQGSLHGAVISSNSWGAPVGGAYNTTAQLYDAATRDGDTVAADNQQMLFVISAGNGGPGANTIGSPGTAKNAMTVGASENQRPVDENGNWTDGCGAGPSDADNAMDTVGFSSRGPTDDGRTKPEITAPGTHITGTQVQGGPGGGTCDDTRPVGNATYNASSGTSHSAPAISGVASLAYWWLENNPEANILIDGGATTLTPSPAALKAWMFAHPTYLTGVSNGGNVPTQSQGYGMPNLELMFDDTAKYVHDQTYVFDDSGEAAYEWLGGVADPAKPVRIALAWSDAPGATTGNAFVNNLDLEVEVGGNTYFGNVTSGGFSVTGGTADSINNYEAVMLEAGASGPMTIRVIPTNIAGNGVPGGDATDQDFSLVIYNGIEEPTFGLTASPALQAVCTITDSTTAYTVDVSSILGFSDPVDLSLSGVPAGATAALAATQVTPGNGTTLDFSTLDQVAFGLYDIEISGTDGTDVRTAGVDLQIVSADAAVPDLDTPADGAEIVDINTVFTWQAAEQADEYLIEIATDEAFDDIIHDALVGGTSYEVPAGSELPSNATLYWRVSSSNTCGGSTSEARSFSTEALPGDCTIGTTPVMLFEDDMEAGSDNWTVGGTASAWALSTTRANSPTTSLFTLDPPAVSDQHLTSAAFNVPALPVVSTLQFHHYRDIEENGTTGCYDAGQLQASTDEGATWTLVPAAQLLTDPYNGPISTAWGNPAGGEQGWCNLQDFTRSVVDLAPYAGESVQFRFRMVSDTSVGAEGWYIDDVAVQACMAPLPPEIFAHGFEGDDS